jgi:hypothetical protein
MALPLPLTARCSVQWLTAYHDADLQPGCRQYLVCGHPNWLAVAWQLHAKPSCKC